MNEAETMTVNDEQSYTDDDIRAQIKPLSSNPIVRGIQRIYRKWLGV